jgi:tetratricopeptide (TPR) repeat protein
MHPIPKNDSNVPLISVLLLIATSCSVPAIADPAEQFRKHDTKGMKLLKDGDNEGALKEFNQAIEIKPDFGIGYTNRIIANYKLGNWDAVIADYEELLRTPPQLICGAMWVDTIADSYAHRGFTENKRGDHAGAIPDLDKAIAFSPYNAEYYHYRALAKQSSGDIKGADEDSKRESFLQSDPLDEADSIALLCRSAEKKDPQHWSDSTRAKIAELYKLFAADLQRVGDNHRIEKYSTGWASELIFEYEHGQYALERAVVQPGLDHYFSLNRIIELRDSLCQLAGKESVDVVEQRLPRVVKPEPPKPFETPQTF